ncbi:hypothetical protein RBB78_08150 [Tunturiibacter empetritectus]|uniref:hypothetical protein n=1 Tax=Tunturiibacter empetritectus TaxID=3069691 RepID=UPI003D9ACCEF
MRADFDLFALRGIRLCDRIGRCEDGAIIRHIGNEREPLAGHNETEVQCKGLQLAVELHRATFDLGLQRN